MKLPCVCCECRCWRESLTWSYVPEEVKRQLRRRIAKHDIQVVFSNEPTGEPVPASLLALEPNLRPVH